MNNKLEQLRKITTLVADTGEIEEIKKYQPEEATTNPSLILKAAQVKAYAPLINRAIEHAKAQSNNKAQQVSDACDVISINIGKEILKIIPGCISTEIDARLSYDTKDSVDKARKLIKMYNDANVPSNRILIKLAATWESVCAAKILEKEGINCNLTLVFSFAQARICAEAGVFLISPFVGRIMDWYKEKEGRNFQVQEDPGVSSVSKIYNYYKNYGYKTLIMGASFRNIEEILELAGCDRLTISPKFLAQLKAEEGEVIQKLIEPKFTQKNTPNAMTHSEFLWEHNQNPMAVEKLAEGIRNFAIDQNKLEAMIATRI
ncbi:transaldolase [Candidatus Photodesmus blepharus]|uniref:Transaldolase n=1 Tax=Candidatus Photodesmus blepharonis TaxID=1179155 RepID=A0A084CM96_9GAMM|nr:transaldolase [Candidatus Photodesmus blepharus]KEY90925.1 transaldolase [Candidatus Photodesmus blepharus]